MRRALLVAIALLASACSAGETELVVVDSADAIEAEFVVESGLDAIAAAQGTPHILWFWGAY